MSTIQTGPILLTALHLLPNLGTWAWAFPVLIGLSCVFTTQHHLIDVPVGAVLGVITYWVYTVPV